MKLANRISKLQPYLFMEISRKIAEKRAKGADVISFGIGDPDLPTPPHIINRLIQTSQDPPNHRYPESDGLPQFRVSIANWYQRRFGLSLNPDKEVVPLIGAKEGIGHMALCLLDPGDIALVPDPGYPVYSVGTMFAGGESYWMPLKEENGWLPDLDAIPPDVARVARVMWLCYPNNPTGAVADLGFFQKAVDFAKRYDIVVCHDACYTEIAYDGYKPVSFLQAKGAMDVGLEFHSLSKSYNMTGWRVGMAVGNADLINALTRVKSNLDSGIPQAIQYAAMEALDGSQQPIQDNIAIYTRRRDKVVAALHNVGLEIVPPKAGLYIWVHVPRGYTSAEFATLLLDQQDLVVTPGNGYGPHGEGYIRFSLTISDADLDRGVARLAKLRIPPKGR
jgi:LL-diaminopimelate aminotransferase